MTAENGGTKTQIELSGRDPYGQGETLTFSITSLPQHGTLREDDRIIKSVDIDSDSGYKVTGSLTLTYKVGENTSHKEDSFTFKASDGKLSSKEDATISVRIVNPKPQKPTFTSWIKKIEVTLNGQVSFNFKVEAPEDANLTYSLKNTRDGDDQWLKIDPNTKKISGVAKSLNQSGDYIINVTDDKGNIDEANFKVVVYKNYGDKRIFGESITQSINLCWDNNSHIHNSDLKKDVVGAIKDSWGKYSAIQFDVFDNCLNDSKQAIKLFLTSSYSNKRYTGYMPYENRVEIKVDENNAINKYDVIRAMGHALGFPKENYRLDTFRAGNENFEDTNFPKNANLCEKIKYPHPVHADDQHAFESVHRNNNNQKVITYKEWQRQPYDHKSIMNYCVDTNEYESSLKNTPEVDMLTESDQKRVQQFYGATRASGDSSDLLFYEGDDLFTGLLKHSDEDSEYSYYQYGRKHPHFTNVNISELGLDGENTDYKKFFAIINDNRSKHILFKYENIDAYVIKQHIPPIFCVTQTESTDQKSPLALDCGHYPDSTLKLDKSKEYEYFYYDSLYETEKKAQLLYCSNEKDNKVFTLDRENAYFVKNLFFDSPQCSPLNINYNIMNYFIHINETMLVDIRALLKETNFWSTNFLSGYFRFFAKGEGYNGSIYGFNTLHFKNGHPYEGQKLTTYDENGMFRKVDEKDDANKREYGHPDNPMKKDNNPIFGPIYPYFYIKGVETDNYCFFEKNINFKNNTIKQKIYYAYYTEDTTRDYLFSNSIYRDLDFISADGKGREIIIGFPNTPWSKEPLNH